MNGNDRLEATLEHRQPDRVCVDIGATFITGMHCSVVTKLREAVLGDRERRVRVIDPYQMLGEMDDELRDALGVDVIGYRPRKSILGTDEAGWKPFRLFDGTDVVVPHNFNTTVDPANGDLLFYPEGDMSAAPSARMPKGFYFFDTIVRQKPIDEERLDPKDNCEEFTLLGEEDLAHFRAGKAWFEERSDCGALLIIPGTGFGDIALVPGPFMKDPKGIRDIQEWYISTAARKDYVKAIFDHQCEVGLKNIETLIDLFGDLVQVAVITGTDFGTQRGLFCSVDAYREMFKPYHIAVNRLIHQKSRWKTFIHSCGSVWDLLPDLIDAGFDVLNPVQCSAAKMSPRELKREFGPELVFWGGGVDTQRTLPFGTPEEVYREVRERIEIFNDGGGFVFNTIHNVQGNTPLDNVLAMFQAIRESND